MEYFDIKKMLLIAKENGMLKNNIKIDNCTTILDYNKFLDSHFLFLENIIIKNSKKNIFYYQNKKMIQVYLRRLELYLKKISK